MPTNFLNENPSIKLSLDHKLDKNAVIELLLWMIIGDCFLSFPRVELFLLEQHCGLQTFLLELVEVVLRMSGRIS